MQILIPFILVSTILTTIVIGSPTKAVVTTKKSSAIAVPKSKGSKKAWKSFGFGNIVGKMMREAKVAFCSELEALVLQMTRPDDSATTTTNYAMLSTCINQDFEDAEFVTSVITKLSRKFKEENIFTKFKSLLCLHAVLQKLNDDAQSSVCHCVDTLKTEEDVKYNQNYFLNEISSKLAGNVAELETVAVLKEYYPYLFYFIELKQSNDNSPDNLSSSSSTSDKASKNKTAITMTENKITSLCQLLTLGDRVTEACEGATSCNNSPLFKQFLDIMKNDREAAVKQLQKICDTKANQALTLSEEIIQTLTAHDVDVDVSAWTVVSGSNSTSESKLDKSTVGAANKGVKSGDNKSSTKSGSSSATKIKSSSATSPSSSKSTYSNSMEAAGRSITKQSHSKISVVDDEEEDEDEEEEVSSSRAKRNIKVAIASNSSNNDKAVRQPSTSSTTRQQHHSTVSSSLSPRAAVTTTSGSSTSASANRIPVTSSSASQKGPPSTSTSGTINSSKPSPTSSSSANNKNGCTSGTSSISKTSNCSKSNNSIKSPQGKTKSTKSKSSASNSSGSTTTKKKTQKSKE